MEQEEQIEQEEQKEQEEQMKQLKEAGLNQKKIEQKSLGAVSRP